MPASSYIPQTDSYVVPKGLTATTTPQGGSAFKDAAGNLYTRDAGGFKLQTSLPAQSAPQAPGLGQGNNPLVSPADAGMTSVAPAPMPPEVKSGLETVANSTGRGLSSVPSTTPAKPIDYTLHQGETIDQYNARIQATRDAQSEGGDTTGGAGTSTGLPSINDFLKGLPAAPTAPNMSDVQSQAENQLGLTGIQQNLQTLNDTYTKLQTDIQQRQAGEASKPGVIAAIINGRMQMISAEDSKAMNDLKLQVSDATKQLTQANTAVQTIMKNTQTDYTNAEKSYQDAFNNAMKVYTAAETQENKAQTTAKANAQVIINSYKGSSVGINSITPDMEAQWSTLETQAGLPPGTIKAAVQAELNVTKFVKGSDGNMYVTGTDSNGVPYTAVVQGSAGAGSGAGGGSSKTPSKTDISGMSSELSTVAGSDGYISPADWQTAITAWTKAGYSTASFVTNFKKYANIADPTNHYAGIK